MKFYKYDLNFLDGEQELTDRFSIESRIYWLQ